MRLLNKLLIWNLKRKDPNIEKRWEEQKKDLVDFDDKTASSSDLSFLLDKRIEHLIQKIGRSIKGHIRDEIKEGDELSEEEFENLLTKLLTYTICRDISKEKNQYWVKCFKRRKWDSSDTWYVGMYSEDIDPIWIYTTKKTIKIVFYISVFSASCLYIYSNYALLIA